MRKGKGHCGNNMEDKYDINGQRFGRLIAIRPVYGKKSQAMWECLCDCGETRTVSYHNLSYGLTKSCGCARGESRARDLGGQRFGRLIAICPTGTTKNGSRLWLCTCDCGNEKQVSVNALTSGNTKSCGCLSLEQRRSGRRDLTGQRFGKLTALEPTNKRKAKSVVWHCRCDCGKESFHTANSLVEGRAKSCGCSRQENEALRHSLDYVDDTCIQFIKNTDKVGVRNSSGCRGVNAFRDKWQAKITFRKKTYYLGTYTRYEDVVKVRKDAESKLYGEFLCWYSNIASDKKTVYALPKSVNI